MNPDTGEIKVVPDYVREAWLKKFQKKFSIPLSASDYEEVKPMNRAQRRAWAKKNKRRWE